MSDDTTGGTATEAVFADATQVMGASGEIMISRGNDALIA